MDFSKPSDKWDRATRAAFTDQIHDAFVNASADAPAGVVCQNVSGSVNSDCPCPHCTGARASHAKALQLASPDDWAKLKPREKARFLFHPRRLKGKDGNDLPDEDVERMVAEREGSAIAAPTEEVIPPGKPGGTATA